MTAGLHKQCVSNGSSGGDLNGFFMSCEVHLREMAATRMRGRDLIEALTRWSPRPPALARPSSSPLQACCCRVHGTSNTANLTTAMLHSSVCSDRELA